MCTMEMYGIDLILLQVVNDLNSLMNEKNERNEDASRQRRVRSPRPLHDVFSVTTYIEFIKNFRLTKNLTRVAFLHANSSYA